MLSGVTRYDEVLEFRLRIAERMAADALKVVERKARKGVNPKTLQRIRIPKSKTVKFVPSKDLKSA